MKWHERKFPMKHTLWQHQSWLLLKEFTVKELWANTPTHFISSVSSWVYVCVCVLLLPVIDSTVIDLIWVRQKEIKQ